MRLIPPLSKNKNNVVFFWKNLYNDKRQSRVTDMKKIFFPFICVSLLITNAFAYQVLSTKEFGKDDAKNQNVIVQCTTDTGKISDETCSLRRYVKCTSKDKKSDCNSWQPWRDLRDANRGYSDWKAAASACCKKKGLR